MFRSKRNLIILIVVYILIITLLSCFNLNVKINYSQYPYVDKSVHFLFFFGLNFLLLNFFKVIKWINSYKRAIAISLLTISYGFVIEIIQHFTGRQFDFNDIVYNVLGVVVSLVVCMYKRKNCCSF